MATRSKISTLFPRAAWYLPARRWLSFRRLVSLLYFRLKRRLGVDYSFSPPGPSSVPLDIFMPTVDKDVAMLEQSIIYARENILHPIGTIYLVAPRDSAHIASIAKKLDCTFIPEDSI